MRWLFLLLMVLNGFYLIWNLQDVPVRAKDVGALAGRQAGASGIQLLSETDDARGSAATGAPPKCVFLGGYADSKELAPLARRLEDAGFAFQPYLLQGPAGAEHWLRLAQGGQGEVKSPAPEVARNISGLREKIIPCEGIATPE